MHAQIQSSCLTTQTAPYGMHMHAPICSCCALSCGRVPRLHRNTHKRNIPKNDFSVSQSPAVSCSPVRSCLPSLYCSASHSEPTAGERDQIVPGNRLSDACRGFAMTRLLSTNKAIDGKANSGNKAYMSRVCDVADPYVTLWVQQGLISH